MAKLTNAQKHELLIQFNEERDALFDSYNVEKAKRKEEEAKSGTQKAAAGEWNKLYKKLGTQNKNKDVRKALQEEVDMYTDNQLSTNMHANSIAGYTLAKHNQISDFKSTFQGKVEDPVDKIYFRQKDEINQYAEAWVKSAAMLTNKHIAPPTGP